MLRFGGFTILGCFVAALLTPSQAAACTACACGDPTLVVVGAEQPFRGRLRFSLTGRGRTLRAIGQSVDEHVLTPSVAYSPSEDLVLTLSVPFMHAQMNYANLAQTNAFGPSDAEMWGRLVVFRDDPVRLNHMVTAAVGAVLPTAADVRTDDPDLSVGQRALGAAFSLAYTYFADPFSVFVSASAVVPIASLQEPATFMFRQTAALQWQPITAFAVRMGAGFRYETPRHGDNSAAAGVLLMPDIVISPLMDVLIVLGVRIPVWQTGTWQEDVGGEVSLIWDLET